MGTGIVITGIGTVCAFGVGLDTLWSALSEGRCGVRRLTRMSPEGFRVHFGGEVPEYAAKDHVPKAYRKAVKVMARCTELAVGAAREAVRDSGLVTREASFDASEATATTYPAPRVGCHIGAGLIAAEAAELASALATSRESEGGPFSVRVWGTTGMGNLQPLWLLKYLPNMLACQVGIIHGAEGPSNTITCAEASGLLSLGESARTIVRGAADVCLSGGGESKLNHVALNRMDLSGRLARVSDDVEPSEIVRPYDAGSPGAVLGEGAGILVLERAESARGRGAKVYASIEGFGAGQASIAALDRGEPDEGLAGAIEGAMREAGLEAGDLGAVVALGQGVPSLDRAEAGGLREALGEAGERLPRVTLVRSVGNCMAGHSALMAGVGAKMASEGVLPGGGSIAGKGILICTGSMGGQAAAMVLRSGG